MLFRRKEVSSQSMPAGGCCSGSPRQSSLSGRFVKLWSSGHPWRRAFGLYSWHFGDRHGFIKCVTFLLLFVGLWPASAVRGQETSAPTFLNGAAQYYLGDKDQILMNVNVWGFVRKPGQYVVPRHTDLISLISFAGGPIKGANLEKVKIIRAGNIATRAIGVGRPNGKKSPAQRVPIFEVDVKRYTERGRISEIPILQAGDTVILPETGGNKFRNFLGFSGILSILAATASVVLIFR